MVWIVKGQLFTNNTDVDLTLKAITSCHFELRQWCDCELTITDSENQMLTSSTNLILIVLAQF